MLRGMATQGDNRNIMASESRQHIYGVKRS